MKELIVLLDGNIVGSIFQNSGRLKFSYADSWQSMAGAYPLSTSMPLLLKDHSHAKIEPFLWGLLPDNELVLQSWAKRFQVSARSAFSLIANVGEDCAGAVQFVPPDRLDALLRKTGDNAVEWLDDAAIAQRLRDVTQNPASGRTPRDTGQFSLAGAQPKTALYFSNGKWGVPSGRVPTTHIFKPPTGDFDGFAENEHLCLSLARALKLTTARSEIMRFEDQVAIVVERYDRQRITDLISNWLREAERLEANAKSANAAGNDKAAEKMRSRATQLETQAKATHETSLVSVLRAHQEDFCQALSVHPANKYQNMGGPGPELIIDHLRAFSTRHGQPETDVLRFIDALIFNWLIGGTDAHAKNYSILIGSGGAVRLAPLYDIASILAYSDVDPRKATLAMKIGAEYKLEKITLSEWLKSAKRLRIDPSWLIERIRHLSDALADHLSDQIKIMRDEDMDHAILAVLQTALTARAGKILAAARKL